MSSGKKKGTHDFPVHRSRSSRRRFHGNQYIKQSPECNLCNQKPKTECTTASTSTMQRSEKDSAFDPKQDYRIISFFSLFIALAEIVICKVCKKKINFGEAGPQGLGYKIFLRCECGNRSINSEPMINNKSN